MQITLFITVFLSFIQVILSITVKDIRDCPAIAPHAPPRNIHDLRVDDITVIAALGDSVTAGMDKGAPSISNLVKHFQPYLHGSSLGAKPARLCPKTFFCLDSHHDPSIDFLNAAQSGATSQELEEQVDYLSQRIGFNTPLAKHWKLINVFIGFNDASISCLPGKSVDGYKANVKNSLRKLIENVDYAFINLVGIMQYSDLIHLTDQQPGYKKKFVNDTIDLLDFECYCCRHPHGGTKFISERVVEYNQALSEIAQELTSSKINDMIKPYLGEVKKNIAVVYQPMNPDTSTVPPYALR
ncbi:uncharacterized protein EV154DRAFT_419179 [Mucor mucedo]|uniref:uncharacterized protein n=1 Tax=Mucor mucedo TaxID=29922 RepID=UPI00221ED944|nr:uncharacterized protein EV154DRAFT_419179 [Mucor mucedo]KAI7892204.1 hypothetical protein EV154DRAFT_419179 [Mucor mucedo]